MARARGRALHRGRLLARPPAGRLDVELERALRVPYGTGGRSRPDRLPRTGRPRRRVGRAARWTLGLGDGRQHPRPAPQPLGVRGAVPGLPAHRRGAGPGPDAAPRARTGVPGATSPTSRRSPSPTAAGASTTRRSPPRSPETRPGPVPVLVVGDHVAPGHVDLRAALRDRGRRRGAPGTARRTRPGRRGGGAVPALGRHHRTPQDHRPDAQRLRVQLPAQRRGLRVRPPKPPIWRCFRSRTTSRSAARACWAPSRSAAGPSCRPRRTPGPRSPRSPASASPSPRWCPPSPTAGWNMPPRHDRRPRAACELLQVGGSVLPGELARELGPGLGCTLQQVYGMAEGLLNYTRPDDPPAGAARDPGPARSPRRTSSWWWTPMAGPSGAAPPANCSPGAPTRHAATTAPRSTTSGRSPPRLVPHG